MIQGPVAEAGGTDKTDEPCGVKNVPMYAYVVSNVIPSASWNKRVGVFHCWVYHGIGRFEDHNHDGPLHITRSGAFIPDCFVVKGRIVVSQRVADHLQHKLGVGSEGVVIERLVQLEMPAVADFRHEGRFESARECFAAMNDVAESANPVGSHVALKCPHLSDVVGRYEDVEEITLDWGSYRYPARNRFTRTIQVAETMLQEHPILLGPCFLLPEDAFAVLAPYLDLDFFAVAVIQVGGPERRKQYEREVEEQSRKRRALFGGE